MLSEEVYIPGQKGNIPKNGWFQAAFSVKGERLFYFTQRTVNKHLFAI